MSQSVKSNASTFAELVEGTNPAIFDIQTHAPGPTGALPLTDAMLREWPSGDLFGLTQNAGMGWNPASVDKDPYLVLSTQGGLRDADGSPIALGYHTGHWEVGLLVREAAETLRSAGMVPFAGDCLRPLRRPHPGHGGDDGQPALSQRRGHRLPPIDPLVAPPQGRDRRGHVRQGAARHDARAGRLPRPARRGRPGRRDAPAVSRRGRGQDPIDRRPLLPRRNHAGRGRRAGLQGLRDARRRLPVPRDGRHGAGRGRGPGPDRPARGPRALGSADLEGCGPQVGARGHEPGSPRPTDARHPHRRVDPQRDGRPRRVRRVDEPAPAHPGHRLRGRAQAAVPRRLARDQPASPPARERPAQRPHPSSHGPRVPRRRRARSHAPPSRFRPARRNGDDRDGRAPGQDARLVGVVRTPQACASDPSGTRRRRSRFRDHEPIAGRGPGAHEHRHVPGGQPRARRLGDQEHGHRPERGRCRRHLSQDRPGQGLHPRDATRSPPSKARGSVRSARETSSS